METLRFKLRPSSKASSFGPVFAREPAVSTDMPPPALVTDSALLKPETQAGMARARTISFPALEYYTVDAARMIGRGCVVSSAGEAIEQTLPFHHVPELSKQQSGAGSCSISYERTRRIAGTSLILPVSSPSMSHFIFEGLPHVTPDFSDLKTVVITCTPQEQYAEIVRMALGRNVDIIFRAPAEHAELWELERAYVPIYRFALHRAMGPLIDRITAHCGSPTATKQHLYISRQDVSHYRTMSNEHRIAARLAEIGFDVIELLDMPEVEIIKRFANAKMVVGPLGAGLYNSIFSPPGTTVVSLCAPNYIRSFMNQCAAFRGLRLGYCFGPDFLSFEAEHSGGHNDFVVDEDAVVDSVIALCNANEDGRSIVAQPPRAGDSANIQWATNGRWQPDIKPPGRTEKAWMHAKRLLRAIVRH